MKSIFTILLGLIAVSLINADEKPIALDKVPKVIMETVKKKFPDAEIVEAAIETAGDKVEYEITLKAKGVKIDIILTSEGKITTIEKTISKKDLPQKVLETLDTKYPKATIETVEAVIKVTGDKEELDYYEVLLVTQDKKKLEVEFNKDGTIKLVEEKKE